VETVGPTVSHRATREAELEAEIERLHKLVEEKDQHAREAAVQARVAGEELERAKERIRKDADRELEQRKRGVLLAFIEVLDDLDRALDAARQGQGAPAAALPGATLPSAAGTTAVVQGVDLVRKGFLARLAQFDVTPLPSLGQRFDPGCHEALSMVPVGDPEKDGLVQGVVREGYRIGEEILRPAAVAVGRYSR
jgi:molecular chaperone GrpE